MDDDLKDKIVEYFEGLRIVDRFEELKNIILNKQKHPKRTENANKRNEKICELAKQVIKKNHFAIGRIDLNKKLSCRSIANLLKAQNNDLIRSYKQDTIRKIIAKDPEIKKMLHSYK